MGLAIARGRFVGTSRGSRTALAAENRFFRKQPALYRERAVEPRRATDPTRFSLVLLVGCFAWREALRVVQPATLIRWHRDALRLFGRLRSRPGRPRIALVPPQLDVKWVPCLVQGSTLYRYAAIDGCTRLRLVTSSYELNLAAAKVFAQFVLNMFLFPVRCVQPDNDSLFTRWD